MIWRLREWLRRRAAESNVDRVLRQHADREIARIHSRLEALEAEVMSLHRVTS